MFDEDEEEKVQVNGKVIKFRNKSCIDYGERATIKVSESAANRKRLYYKCERLDATTSSGGSHLALSTKSLREGWEHCKMKKRTIDSMMKTKS